MLKFNNFNPKACALRLFEFIVLIIYAVFKGNTIVRLFNIFGKPIHDDIK